MGLTLGLLVKGTMAWAQPDYASAHWVPPTGCDKWYTTGYGHSFCVIHDMEGYYEASISYLNTCSVQASVYYLANGLQNGSDSLGHHENNLTDAPAGDLTQSVREQYYAWHVVCWNRYMFGTEHEGFVTSPVWFSEAMYQASAGLQRHLCDTYGIPKDRNHIIGHNEWQNAAWTSWMATNWPQIDTTCNTHTDPGQYWDWTHFMALINTNPTSAPTITNQPQSLVVNLGDNAAFNVTAGGTTPLYYQWLFNGGGIPGATVDTYTRSNAQPGDAGNYSVVISNQAGSVTSSSATLTVNTPPSITGQPQSQIVYVGQNVAFTVAASGTAPLSYEWQFNGNPLFGATASSYLLTPARSVDVGSYSVVVSNGLGSVVSTNATLGVIQDAACGDNTLGQGTASGISTNLIAIAAGGWHNLSLAADGTVSAWGNDSNGQCDVPATLADALAIAAGGYHSLALGANGSVVAWGANDYGQTSVPVGLAGVIGIAAGTWHSVALRANGTVVVWGDNSFGQTNLPAGLTNVTAVAARGSHTLALKTDGTVVAWGENTDAEGNVTGQSVVPWGLTNVVAIGAGEYHSLAVKRDGTVVTWGDDSQGQGGVPEGLANVVAVSGGGGHSVALGADGKVTAWGADWNGQCDLPPGLAPASGIAAGEYHTLVLLQDSLPVPRLLNPTRKGNQFSALAQTLSPKNYALEFKSSLAATNWTAVCTNGGNGALRILTDPVATGAQRFYRMRQW
jgi:alpha-tubulin suppressor-like RCC1 family protein/N-acetyl-anhydromuramyl-L-alanine amidase AmpD